MMMMTKVLNEQRKDILTSSMDLVFVVIEVEVAVSRQIVY